MAEEYNKKNTKIVYASLSFLFITEFIGAIGYDGGYIKYTRFLIPFFLLVYFLKNQKIKKSNYFFRKEIKLQITTYLFASIITILTSVFALKFGFTERNLFHLILFLSVPISFFFYSNFLSKVDLEEIINNLFWFFVVIFIVELVRKGLSITSILSFFNKNILTNSTHETESGKSLVFVFFLLYFLSRKNYSLILFSFALVLLGGKRIAIVGVVLSALTYLVLNFKIFSRTLQSQTFKISILILLLLIPQLWIIIYTGKFDNLINQFTGLSADAFLMGRVGIITGFFRNAPDDFNLITGYGLGYVENVLHYKMNYKTNFHNDHLRMYLELGLVFFSFWIWRFLKICNTNPLSFSIFMLLIILLQTDNVLIYENVMYTFYFILFYSVSLGKIKYIKSN